MKKLCGLENEFCYFSITFLFFYFFSQTRCRGSQAGGGNRRSLGGKFHADLIQHLILLQMNDFDAFRIYFWRFFIKTFKF